MDEDYKVKTGICVCSSSPADDQSLSDVRQWISDKGLSSDDVAIRRSASSISVYTKREIILK